MESAWLRESGTSWCDLGCRTPSLWAWALSSASPSMRWAGRAGTGLRWWPRIQRDAGEKEEGKGLKERCKINRGEKRIHTPACICVKAWSAYTVTKKGSFAMKAWMLSLIMGHFQPLLLRSWATLGMAGSLWTAGPFPQNTADKTHPPVSGFI